MFLPARAIIGFSLEKPIELTEAKNVYTWVSPSNVRTESQEHDMALESTILIVDDQVTAQKTLRALLLDQPYNLAFAATGEDALSQAAELDPDLILLDLHLPGADGPEILDYIRAQEHLKSTRIIIATADARKAEELHEKADIVFVKPIRFTQLKNMALRLKPE